MIKINKLFKNKLDNKGFSLIELVIVIAILGVISGIAIPQINGVIINSKKNTDLVNATTIATAVMRGIVDKKIIPPQESGEISLGLFGVGEDEGEEISEGQEIGIEQLVDMGYLHGVPNVKYIEGDFKAKVDSNGKITVLIQETSTNQEYIVYPEMDEVYAK